jgi:ArsR family transcriptional regulator
VAPFDRLRRAGGDGSRLSRPDQVDKSTNVDILTLIYMKTSDEAAVACCAPLAAPVLGEEEAAATAELFKALADPARVRIVNTLATHTEPVCACEFEPALGLSQPTVSHHLKKLLDAGLLEREQRGKWAYFSLKRDAVEKLAAVADLKGACC